MNNFDVFDLLKAYCQGYFPMADEHSGEIFWYSPEFRAVFPIEQIKPPKSLLKELAKNPMHCTVNNDFEAVIHFCSNRETTWISDEIAEMYCELHKTGFAHSVETWQNGKLVVGLYGVSIGGAFFGESMFNIIPNASKVAFYFLIEYLKNRNFSLLDSQFINDFTAQLGAKEIPKEEYLQKLKIAISQKCSFV